MPQNDFSTHGDRPKLHFAYATSEPNLDAFDVKRVVPSDLCGEPAALTVIGESHYVGVPALEFHEVCSCKPVSGDSTAVTPLESGVEREFAFETDRLRVETEAEVRPIEEFPGPDGTDAAYRFGPDAWTTIKLNSSPESAGTDESAPTPAPDSSATYETYHTYPEHDLAVYTFTRLYPARRAHEAPASRKRTADGASRSDDDSNPDHDTSHS
ncbi:hypothetical protein [Halorussus salinus]|uniref:hypothetical protein n=1 Tax=Halorussus salinus TaxID=1364935 RepID=UPI00192F32D1|nr:hypothetical protein [Halorussus salinus]